MNLLTIVYDFSLQILKTHWGHIVYDKGYHHKKNQLIIYVSLLSKEVLTDVNY